MDPSSVRNRDDANRQPQLPHRTLHTDYDSRWGGHRYRKVLDVTAPHEVSYAIPDGAQTFAAVAGFRALYIQRPGVIYRVLVDGQKRFDSGEYYGFDALPVVVDVRGASTLKIVVKDMRDGTDAHEALLAEPRFLLE